MCLDCIFVLFLLFCMGFDGIWGKFVGFKLYGVFGICCCLVVVSGKFGL